MMNRKVEILAPAGSKESLIAAVNAGADAVYIGGSRFGARAYAENLKKEELLDAIDFVHIHGRKIYLTVNTLLKENEINELYDYLLPYYERGLDAVIVQDIGVMEFVKEYFPDLPIHVSTQATVTGPWSARFFMERGASRIVPARELSLREVEAVKKQTGLEIECFVHGALCYCYSGQCLMSSMIGGRSGNRGQCAQPCRLTYSVERGKKQDLLSLKDLCTIELLPELICAGVDSFKIEGRMKQPEYVYTVVCMYRKYVDLYLRHGKKKFHVSQEDRQILEGSFRRRGYTDGYYKRQNGRDMISLERPKTDTEEKIQVPDEKIKEKINGKLILSKGEHAKLYLSFRNFSIVCEGDTVQQAMRQPLEKGRVEKQMRKTGNTEFVFDHLEVLMEEEIFLPMQALNELRRNGLEKLEEAILSGYQRTAAQIKETVRIRNFEEEREIQKEPELSALVTKNTQLQAAGTNCAVNTVYVESSLVVNSLEETGDWRPPLKTEKKYFLAMPYIFREQAADVFEKIYTHLKRTFDGVLVRNWESVQWLKDHGYSGEIRSDYNLYVFNTYSKAELKKEGIRRFTAPVELNARELDQLNIREAALIVYGHQPVMITANCVRKTSGTCTQKDGVVYLTDRYQKKSAVKTYCTYCYNVIHNCQPLILMTQREEVLKLRPAELRVDFTEETSEECDRILTLNHSAFLEKKEVQLPVTDYTKGHFKRGVK